MSEQSLSEVITQDLGVDLQVNMEHVVAIASSRKEREYKAGIKKWQLEVRILQRNIKDSESSLTRLARKRGISWFQEKIKDFNRSAKALKITISADVKDCGVYEDDQGSTVHRVWVATECTTPHAYRSTHDSSEHNFDLEKDDELSIEYWAIDNLKDDLRKAAERLAENQRALHDLPSLERQATAQIAEASLSSTEAGRTILENINGLETTYLLGE